MAIYRMNKRPSALVTTMHFDTFNEAVSFYKSAAVMEPSKPYKTVKLVNGAWLIQWNVTLGKVPVIPPGATFTRIAA